MERIICPFCKSEMYKDYMKTSDGFLYDKNNESYTVRSITLHCENSECYYNAYDVDELKDLYSIPYLAEENFNDYLNILEEDFDQKIERWLNTFNAEDYEHYKEYLQYTNKT